MVSAFSVPKAKRQQKYSSNPGPGNYNSQASPKHVNPSDPKYSFGKLLKSLQYSKNPGPGSYQLQDTISHEHSPQYSIQGRKDINQFANLVGPGQYSPSQGYVRDKSPAYSMGGKGKNNYRDGKPGPGNYQLKSDLDQITKKHGWKFSKQQRDNLDKRNVPGPGSYLHQSAIFKFGSQQDPAYGFGQKFESPKSFNNPGPGSYEDRNQIYSKIGGIISRDLKRDREKSFTPGPGNYKSQDIHGVAYKQPSWSMSKSSRDKILKNISLGPGHYQVDKYYKSIVTSSPGYHFGSDKKSKYESGIAPGPGQYQNLPVRSNRGITIGQKVKDSSKNYVPGPGSYEYSIFDNNSWLKGSGRYTLGKSVRDLNLKKHTPGPGTYDSLQGIINKNKGKGTFGKESRLKIEKNRSPGPGHYILKPTFADVPKYLLPDKL